MPISLSICSKLSPCPASASCEYRPHVRCFSAPVSAPIAGQQPLSQDAIFDDIAALVRTPSLSNGVDASPFSRCGCLQWSANPAEFVYRASRARRSFTVDRTTRYRPHQMTKQPCSTSLAKITGAFMVESLRGDRAIRYGEHSRPQPTLAFVDRSRTPNGVGVITLHIAIFFGDSQLESE